MMHLCYLKFSLTIKTEIIASWNQYSVMSLVKITLIAAIFACSLGHRPKDSIYNIGWDKFLDDSPDEFHNIPLTWETDNPIPDYVVGSYIKNGPSQKRFEKNNKQIVF